MNRLRPNMDGRATSDLWIHLRLRLMHWKLRAETRWAFTLKDSVMSSFQCIKTNPPGGDINADPSDLSLF